jgi:hypothetical protein
MLTSLPLALFKNVLSFTDDYDTSVLMCSSRELRDAVSATMALSQAIVFTQYPPLIYNPHFNCGPTLGREYGPTLQQWLHHYSPTLTSLSLRDCHFLTDQACMLLAARFPLITTLDVSGCIHVTAKGVKKITQVCKSLTTFQCDTTTGNM